MLGRQIVNKNYRKVRIAIAFHPGGQRFEVTNPAIRRDRTWLADIATLFAPGTRLLRVVDAYYEGNAEANRDDIYERIERLRGIQNNSLGLIETREFEEVIAEASFRRLEAAILRFMNETDFKRFVMFLRSAGFVNASMIRSQNTVNFAYILNLTLRARRTNPAHIETLVRRWFVMAVLTGRYTGSPETTFGVDIRNIAEQNAQDYLNAMERAELSDAFWDAGLPQQVDTSVASNPYFNVFLASQVKSNHKGFLSSDHTVQTLLEGASHVHHVFPRNYLKTHGLARSR